MMVGVFCGKTHKKGVELEICPAASSLPVELTIFTFKGLAKLSAERAAQRNVWLSPFTTCIPQYPPFFNMNPLSKFTRRL